MTREEAIEIIKSECYVFNPLNFDRSTMVNTALDMAVKALKQEPCEDAIDRAEAMTEIMMFAGNVKPDEEDVYLKVSDAVQLLRELPSVTPKPKMGRWIYIQYDGNPRIGNWKCSLCMRNVMFGQNQNDKPLYNYCPNCGAKMESEERNEEI